MDYYGFLLSIGIYIGLWYVYIRNRANKEQRRAAANWDWEQKRRVSARQPSGHYFATYYGDEPRAIDTIWSVLTSGVIRLVDRKLVFQGYDVDQTSVTIPLVAIRWAGIYSVLHQASGVSWNQTVFAFHYVNEQQNWRVAAFSFDSSETQEQFMLQMSRLSSLPKLNNSRIRWSVPQYNAGPFLAIELEQDIYGQWHNRKRCALYVTPTGQLLRDFQVEQLIALADLRAINVIARGEILTEQGKTALDVLRLEYDEAGKHRVVGFKMRQADELAQALADRSGVPYAGAAGRKKKANS